jgi:predicted Zn-dependent peptidase
MTTLENGVRVCSEKFSKNVATIGVIIGAGSRNETLETNGVAHFMEHLNFKV